MVTGRGIEPLIPP